MRNFALLISLIFSLNVSCQIDNIAEKLGYNKDAKLLIIHGDDIGVSHSVNIASFDGYKNNAINSGSAMIPSPWIKEVAAFHKKNPNYDIGLHLTLTAEWKNYKWDGVSSSNKFKALVFVTIDTSLFLCPTSIYTLHNFLFTASAPIWVSM